MERWRLAASLLGVRQRILLAAFTTTRVAVGVCDLALAYATYLLFVLLQGRAPAHSSWPVPSTVLGAALLASLLAIIRAAVDAASSRGLFRFIQTLYVDFLIRLTRGYSTIRWEELAGRNRSELLHHTQHSAREAADFYHRCIELAAAVVIVAAMTTALVYQSAVIAVAFGCLPVLLYGLHRLLIRNSVYHAASQREAYLARMQKAVMDVLSASKEIRVYGNQRFFTDRIDCQARVFAAQHCRAVFLPQAMRIVAEQGTVLLFLALIAAVALQHGDTQQLLSLLAFYFVLSRRLLPLISQISLIAGQMESSFENAKMVAAELDRCRTFRAPLALPQFPGAGLALELRKVSFWFHRDAPVLRDIDLVLREGEVVVLHGASGAGKTSLLNVIAGILQPIAGSVRVYRSTIAYVPQDVILLDDSIRNNLLFGLSPRPDEELMRALAAANLADVIRSQPHGLDTPVGDNGALWSGGQRQRLGLARAILRQCRLMLLDEATSAVDPESERQILANLSARGAAILLVTHRRHAFSFGQRVCRLHEGVLVEEPPQRSWTHLHAAGDGAAVRAGVKQGR